MTYDLITDLTTSLREREPALSSLAAAWKERCQELQGRDELATLNERMRRRWAIDTGMIEGLYSMGRGTTQLLIDRGLHADLISHGESDLPAAQLVSYLHDHAEVYDWLFEFVAQERPFGTSWIKELHQLLTRHQTTTDSVDTLGRQVEVPLQRGAWKTLPNNPTRPDGGVHVYCPPESAASEMSNLVEWHVDHGLEVSPEVEAAWLHHRFTQIHPFQDGNGRVARAIASLVLIRAGCFPFSVSSEQKAEYIDALEIADAGDLVPLVEFIAAQERRDFGRALAVAEQLADEHQLFRAGFAKARRAREDRAAEYEDAKELAAVLMAAAHDDFTVRQQEFARRAKAAGVAKDHHVHVFRPPETHRHYYRVQIETVAHSFGYFPNFTDFRDWVRLTIVNDLDARVYVLLVSVHGFGRSFKGVMAALALVQTIDREGNGDQERNDAVHSPPVAGTAEPFDFGYLDIRDHVVPRFREWLHGSWLSVLKHWEDGL